MEKEYISTIVIDSESAAKDWHELPEGKQPDNATGGKQKGENEAEFSGVHTWVS